MSSYLQSLHEQTKAQLVNTLYNTRVSHWADYDKEDKQRDTHGHGKRIPYLGWFWRTTDFVNKRISIGNSGSFIGVMENNKWDYSERLMTEQEVDTFIEYLEQAFAKLDRGGNVTEIHAQAEQRFDELWDWFQTLDLEYHEPVWE